MVYQLKQKNFYSLPLISVAGKCFITKPVSKTRTFIVLKILKGIIKKKEDVILYLCQLRD
ncbi:hypothetical protein pb186bvf_008583 [Paramecium bursaria]